jgi:hypothetical protein
MSLPRAPAVLTVLSCAATLALASRALSPPAKARESSAAGQGARLDADTPLSPVGMKPELGYRLVKNWDFKRSIRDGNALRAEFATRYIYEQGALDHLNNEWSRYRDNENHVFGPSGCALVAKVDGAPAPGRIESGMLRSRWSGRYGVFEVRMKVPSGRGLWPAFWLNPQDQKWPPEIDVVEIVDNGRDSTDRSFHFLHGAGVAKTKPLASRLDKSGSYRPGVDYSLDFHVFAVEWTRDRVRHLVDGVVVADRGFRWIHEDGSDAGDAHVLVNLAVGGKWPGPPVDPSIFPARLELETIRVWQK